MTHDEIEEREYVDNYVRGTLDAETRTAFEAHYFECERCFAAVQEAERLRDAVRTGISQGWFSAPAASSLPATLRPAVRQWEWLAAAAVLVLGAGLGWAVFYRIPQLETELTRARTETPSTRSGDPTIAPAAPPATSAPLQARANVPVIALRAERSAPDAVPSLRVPPEAPDVVLLIDAPAGLSSAGLTIARAEGGDILALEGLRPNDAGVFTVGVPAARVPPDVYRLRLHAAGRTVGEFLLRIER